MRRYAFLSLVVTVLLLMATLSALAQEQRETVFRDLAFGDPIDVLDKPYPSGESEEPGITIYRQTQENLRLGSVPLRRIEYHYFDDRLYRVVVYPDTRGDYGHQAVIDMLVARYGEHDRRPFLSNNREWTRGDTFIQFLWPMLGDTKFVLQSVPIGKEYEAWLAEYRREQAQKSADDW